MKKTLFTVLFAVATIGVAYSDVLYWMVGYEYNGVADSASLYAVNGGEKNAIDTRTSTQIANAWDSYGNFEAQLGTSMGSGWTYFVEVVTGSSTKATAEMTYQQLVDGGYIYSDMSRPSSAASIPNGGFGGGATSYNVPEPTSGLLFLVGGMLLGLKRRRQKV